MGDLMIDHALGYAIRGWAVFPCAPRGKRPLCLHGLKDATCDKQQIREWWAVERWPDANIALPTGIVFDVLDLDTIEAGLELADAHKNDLPDAPCAFTSKGTHIYFKASGIGNKAGFIPDCDWRGAGGYVIAPPSLHETGCEYTWEVHPDDRPLPDVPQWLRELLEPPAPPPAIPWATWRQSRNPKRAYALAALRNKAVEVAATPEGQRNHELFKAAARCAQLGVPDSEIEPVLTEGGRRAGLGDTETRQTIRSGISRGRTNERR